MLLWGPNLSAVARIAHLETEFYILLALDIVRLVRLDADKKTLLKTALVNSRVGL